MHVHMHMHVHVQVHVVCVHVRGSPTHGLSSTILDRSIGLGRLGGRGGVGGGPVLDRPRRPSGTPWMKQCLCALLDSKSACVPSCLGRSDSA
jgi:hypothetical protein